MFLKILLGLAIPGRADFIGANCNRVALLHPRSVHGTEKAGCFRVDNLC